MIKRMLIMLTIVCIVLGAISGFKVFQGAMMKKYMMAGMPPQSVSTIKAEIQDWQPSLQAVGSLRALNGADLSSEVAGIVQSIAFESGSEVAKGALLVQLRADDDIARLHALEATANLANITYQRDLKQLQAQAVSRAVVDNDVASLKNAQAQVAAQAALVEKKTIRAPYPGRLGIRRVDIGQYLNPGTPIVTLQQLDPIFVDFSLPEQGLARIALGQKVALRIDAHPDQSFAGEITAINAKVDEATRNIAVRATFANPDHVLLPGMFGKVDIEIGKPERFLTLPQTSIVYNTYGNVIYLVKPKKAEDGAEAKGPDGKPQLEVQQSVVVTGETRGDQVAVVSGLNEGDEVVTTGQVKLRNGTSVVINNEVQPSNDVNPTPHDQ